MAHSKPRVIVGLDFGTTFSGFAYAHIAEPQKVYTFFDYPKAAAEKPYCKTLTGSYYKSWGYPARADCTRDILACRKQRESGDPLQLTTGTYATWFKLYLASADMGAPSSALPPELTLEFLITDYLREMGALILMTLQRSFGAQLTKQAIQWCVMVPSIWDNAAKATMKAGMAVVGIVNVTDGSRHPLVVVLQPEAASFYCHKAMAEEQVLRVGEKLLVADIGGGTADIVVQEWWRRDGGAGMVAQVISPPNPGSAVCQDAVMLPLNPNSVISRVCKKTYGIETGCHFDENRDPPESKITIDGESWCNKQYSIYVRRGDKVDVNSCISKHSR